MHTSQVRHFINAHKILTPVVVISLMVYFNFWGTLAWIYLVLHGTYCLLWMIKEYTYRDRRFEEAIHPVAGLIFVFGMLGLYWIAPYLIISQRLDAQHWLIALSIFLVVLGVFYHFASDAKKYVQLGIRKGLITNGLFSRTRNPILSRRNVDLSRLYDSGPTLAALSSARLLVDVLCTQYDQKGSIHLQLSRIC